MKQGIEQVGKLKVQEICHTWIRDIQLISENLYHFFIFIFLLLIILSLLIT